MTQPTSTLYGGAHLFKLGAATKLGDLARRFASEHLSTPARLVEALGLAPDVAEAVAPALAKRMATAPLADLRVDFEDGYGPRPDDEEDRDADRAAEVLSTDDALPARVGVRVKAIRGPTAGRSLRTLARVMGGLRRVPAGFSVTLPKVSAPDDVTALADALDALEAAHGLPRTPIELMIEHPRALYAPSGALALPLLVLAGRGRVRGTHLGTYDLTASLGVVAREQTPDHPLADHARALMLYALAETEVEVSDGATTTLPIAPHRGESLTDAQHRENRAAVDAALRAHVDAVTRALRLGIHQGWDLHPAQLPARHAAVLAFYLGARASMQARLAQFLERKARATRVGTAFDDAATGQGLVAFFARGIDAGAFDEVEVAASLGVPVERLRSRSFADLG